MNAVVEMKPATQLPEVVTPMTMIEKALASGASPEHLEKLLTLQERWEAAQARKAFITAMALARAEFKPILKKNQGYSNRYQYETITDVMDAVDGPLGKYGFSYDWVTEDLPDGRIRVTCVVTHEAGHSRSNSLSGDPKDTADAKANMNGLQRMGGAVTYLQRYTLKAALGIAASKDTDGNGGNTDYTLIDAEQFRELQALIEESNSEIPKLLAYVKGEELEKLNVTQHKMACDAMRRMIAKKKEAK